MVHFRQKDVEIESLRVEKDEEIERLKAEIDRLKAKLEAATPTEATTSKGKGKARAKAQAKSDGNSEPDAAETKKTFVNKMNQRADVLEDGMQKMLLKFAIDKVSGSNAKSLFVEGQTIELPKCEAFDFDQARIILDGHYKLRTERVEAIGKFAVPAEGRKKASGIRQKWKYTCIGLPENAKNSTFHTFIDSQAQLFCNKTLLKCSCEPEPQSRE